MPSACRQNASHGAASRHRSRSQTRAASAGGASAWVVASMMRAARSMTARRGRDRHGRAPACEGRGHQRRRLPFVVAARRAGNVDGVVEQQRELLGLVEIGRVLAGERDQLVEMAGIVIGAMGLRVVRRAASTRVRCASNLMMRSPRSHGPSADHTGTRPTAVNSPPRASGSQDTPDRPEHVVEHRRRQPAGVRVVARAMIAVGERAGRSAACAAGRG